jgi:hypothetical protein
MQIGDLPAPPLRNDNLKLVEEAENRRFIDSLPIE